jgi:SWI/SNF-related matrix-associated actin-dependent regulator of chromatin subfamily A3
MVLVRRERSNQYDINAIQVLNVSGTQIGHLPRPIAAKLASFMDNRSFFIEGMATDYKGSFDCPVALKFYGSSDPVIRNQVKNQMKEKRLPTDGLVQLEKEEREKEKKRGELEMLLKKAGKGAVVGMGKGVDWNTAAAQFASSSAAGLGLNLDDFMKESEKFNPRSFDEMTAKFGMTEESLKEMKMAKQPNGVASKLLPFQLQGLQWMLDKESPQQPPVGSKESVQLWKRVNNKPHMFHHLATNYSVDNKLPHLASGGILADDMGLGKTIQVISLIVADRELGIPRQQGVSDTTLIIAPLSVMSNWTAQIKQHVKEDLNLSIKIYHGQKRDALTAEYLKDVDVLVTTYDTVRVEHFGKAASHYKTIGLNSVRWRRVVLDEGHTIRNPGAKIATAICALQAQSRWALTGTPIVNTLKDLFSLVRFLGLSGGINQWELFNGAIIRPLNAGMERASYLLQTLMNSICLRRKKEMKFIDLKLPELSEYIHKVDFTAGEKEQYDALAAEAEGTLEDYIKAKGKSAGDASKAYRNLLEILLRLRQFCNHWKLVGEERLKALDGLEGQVLDLTPENRELLENMLKLNIESQEECPICIDSMTDPVITLCSHSFCYACIERVIDTQHKCPMCRAPLEDSTKVLRPPKEGTDTKQEEPTFQESSRYVSSIISSFIVIVCLQFHAANSMLYYPFSKPLLPGAKATRLLCSASGLHSSMSSGCSSRNMGSPTRASMVQ